MTMVEVACDIERQLDTLGCHGLEQQREAEMREVAEAMLAHVRESDVDGRDCSHAPQEESASGT